MKELILQKEIDKANLQKQLDNLRDQEAQFFDKNAEMDRAIDERYRTN